MRLKTRIHEWLADHVSWVQYPQIKPVRPDPRRRLDYRWSVMTGQQRGWVLFAIFWGGVLALAAYGSFLD